jgi:hypothetical protein
VRLVEPLRQQRWQQHQLLLCRSAHRNLGTVLRLMLLLLLLLSPLPLL